MKYDVAKLQSGGSESTVKVLFRQTVSVKAKETWKVNRSIEKLLMMLPSWPPPEPELKDHYWGMYRWPVTFDSLSISPR